MNFEVNLKPRRFYWCLYVAGFFSLVALGNPFFWILVVGLCGLAYKAQKDGSCFSKDLNLSTIHKFQTDGYEKLQTEYNSITSFDAVAEWDLKANSQICEVEKYNELLSEHIIYLEAKIKEYKAEREVGKFPERFMKYHTKERVVATILEEVLKINHDSLISNLKSQIEFSPNDNDEKKAILEKLNDIKDELKEMKKDIADDKRNVRERAKNRNAEIANSFFSSPKSRRLDRQANRNEKEQALYELENRKNQIIEKISFVDRQIAWVKQISGKSKVISDFDISSSDKTKTKAS